MPGMGFPAIKLSDTQFYKKGLEREWAFFVPSSRDRARERERENETVRVELSGVITKRIDNVLNSGKETQRETEYGKEREHESVEVVLPECLSFLFRLCCIVWREEKYVK